MTTKSTTDGGLFPLIALFSLLSRDRSLADDVRQIGWHICNHPRDETEEDAVVSARQLMATLRSFVPFWKSAHVFNQKTRRTLETPLCSSSPPLLTDVSEKEKTSCHRMSVNTVEVPYPVRALIPAARKKIKIYADGVFDLMHSGHFNAFRQARLLGDHLTVGVCSDDEVLRAKGALPIYSLAERTELVRGCKWVDEILEATPYDVTLDFLRRTGCDYVAHGDDMAPNGEGEDCYSEPRAAGLLKVFKRTLGISSTALVSRLLFVTADMPGPAVSVTNPTPLRQWLVEEGLDFMSNKNRESSTSTKRLLQFIGEPNQPKATDKIVYVDGSFDVFHVGHLRILQKAKEFGDYLIVGIHDDAVVAKVKGLGFPVMNLLERAMNVLAMRVVDEVILGAPWSITDLLIKTFRIDVVVSGLRIDSLPPFTSEIARLPHYPPRRRESGEGNSEVFLDVSTAASVSDSGASSHLPVAASTHPNLSEESNRTMEDNYRIPKSLGIFYEVDSETTITTTEIIQRIVRNRLSLLKTIRQRSKKESNIQQASKCERASGLGPQSPMDSTKPKPWSR